MKKLKLEALTINFKKAQREFKFDEQITFFHGPTSTGKSSVARLIDYCLGGSIKAVPALKSELVSCKLIFSTEKYLVQVERNMGETKMQVSWTEDGKNFNSITAKEDPDQTAPPIWGRDIYGISDLLLFLLGGETLWVRKRQYDDDSPLIRLSFRDFLWYCYLRQDQLDNDFFKLYSPAFLANKSRDVQRFIFGFHSSKLNRLQRELENIQLARRADRRTADELTKFLADFGYESEASIHNQILMLENELMEAVEKRDSMRKDHQDETHFVDHLRQDLVKLSGTINEYQRNLTDAERIIEEQKKLRSEVISTKFKIGRSQTALKVLSEVSFEICPACGIKVHASHEAANQCGLCHQNTDEDSGTPFSGAEMQLAAVDLTNRADELQDSINRRIKSAKETQRTLEILTAQKRQLDFKLNEELKQYDSLYVANSRMYEQKIAEITERLRNLGEMLKMPQKINLLLEKVDQAEVRERALRRAIDDEKKSFKLAGTFIEELENTYLYCLLKVGMPDVTSNDKISINRTSWIPSILKNGDADLNWDYNTAGAGGQTTLLKICYALAFHIVAEKNELPLPSLLIVDSAMKNLAGKENAKYVKSLYALLYECAQSSLKKHQFILIDSDFFSPPSNFSLKEIRMSKNDPKFPPLVPYYVGD